LDQQAQSDGHAVQRSSHPDGQDFVFDTLPFPQHRVHGAAGEDHKGAMLREAAVLHWQMGVSVAFQRIKASAPIAIDPQ